MPNYRDDPDYRDMRESSLAGRAFVAPHVGAPHGDPVFIMPAVALTIGRTTLGKGTFQHPTVTLFGLNQPAAFCFLPTADELEMLSEAMAKEAARLRADAGKHAEDLIRRARQG